MLNHMSDRHLKNQSRSIQVSVTQKQLLAQKYLRSPFSVSLSKLEALFEVEALNN